MSETGSSVSGTSEIIKTSETVSKDGTKIIERFNIVRNWGKMSRKSKWSILGYGLGFVTTMSFYTYNDGKKALLRKRLDDSKSNQFKDYDTIVKEEWITVKDGCQQNTFDNFCSSLFFPITILSETFPSIVMWMNSSPTKYKELKN